LIKIIADTLSCISVEDANHLGIPLLPQMIIFGEEIYRDDTEIDTTTFLSKLKISKDLPKTAAPSPALYHPIYEEILSNGDTPLVVCPTSELSGTYRSAVVAGKDFPNAKIHVVDTKSIGAGLGSMVKQAVLWAEQGLTAEEIETRLQKMASRERIFFMVATLEYLHKGGRIGGAQALVGSVLQVKPILQFKDGRIEPAGSQRTRKKAISHLHQLVAENCPRTQLAFLSVMHGDVLQEANELVSMLSNITGIENIPLFDLPAAILVHGGPGAFGISYFVEE